MSMYLGINAAILLMTCGIALFGLFIQSFRRRVQLARWSLLVAVIAPFTFLGLDAFDSLPANEDIRLVPPQVMQTIDQPILSATIEPMGQPLIESLTIDIAWQDIFLLFLLTLFASNLFMRVRQISAVMRRSQLFKKVGRLEIRVSDRSIPVAFSTLTRSIILIPEEYFLAPADLRLAIRHEGIHHRHGDTRWLWFMELLTPLFLINPATYWLRNWFQCQHEFACDESLLGHKRSSPKQYALCLLKAAEQNFAQPGVVGTAALATGKKSFLERRISMFQRHRTRKSRSAWLRAAAAWVGITGLGATIAAGSMLAAAKNTTPLSMDQAQILTERIQNSEFPIEVNDLVLQRLNEIITDDRSRTSMRNGLARMAQYRDMIFKYSDHYDLPRELIAVALVESRFRNLDQSTNGARGAGIWMFIPTTARRFGMKVDESTDERLDPEIESDAAMRYLKANYLVFGNWWLSMAGYNQGEGHVYKKIVAEDTRDPWELAKRGAINNYIATVMASIIIMHNPNLVD